MDRTKSVRTVQNARPKRLNVNKVAHVYRVLPFVMAKSNARTVKMKRAVTLRKVQGKGKKQLSK